MMMMMMNDDMTCSIFFFLNRQNCEKYCVRFDLTLLIIIFKNNVNAVRYICFLMAMVDLWMDT